MPTDPNSLAWAVVGTAGGKQVKLGTGPGLLPLTPAARAHLAAAVDAAQPATPPQPPVTPTVPTVPTATPAMPRKVADHAKVVRGNGLDLMNKPGAKIGPGILDGYEQNVYVHNSPGASLYGMRSLRAFGQPSQAFVGQGAFVEKTPDFPFDNYFAYQSGWQPGRPIARRNVYYHGIYYDWQSPRGLVKNSILWLSSNCGVQFKAGGRIEDTLIIDNGTGIQAVLDKCEVVRCTIYDGHHWYSPEGAKVNGKKVDALSGMTAIQTYCPTLVQDTWVIGTVGQSTPRYEPQMPHYEMGGIVGSSVYVSEDGKGDHGKHFVGQPGASFTFAGDCRVYGWPGPAYAKDNKALAAAGLTVLPKAAPRIDLQPLLAECLSGVRAIGDIQADWSARLRNLVA